VNERSAVLTRDRSPERRTPLHKFRARTSPAIRVDDYPGFGTDAILRLQRQAGNAAVTGLLTGGVHAFSDLLIAGERLLSTVVERGAEARENELTDQLFWLEKPELKGERLQAGSPEAMRWLRIRESVVRPLLRTHPTSETTGGWGPTTKTGVPTGMVPVDQVAAASTSGSAGATKASVSDKYFVQDVGRYQDSDDKGAARVWSYGSSGMNICNMTTLTMGLVSMAGESEVRTKIIALLRSKGLHTGASVQVGDKWVSLAEALDDPKVVERIALLDLVTAAAIGEHGAYQDVTVPGTIARIAKESGLAVGSATVRGQPRLATEKGRALAQEMLASGKRVLAGTVNHYVYLIEVRDDGAIVHDPAGARVEPKLKGPVFLHGGSASSIAREWSRLDATRREAAVRRVSTNPPAAAVVNRLIEISAMPEDERKADLLHLAKDNPGHIATGARNFYAATEFSDHDLRLVVSLA
jgi:hypothetical protein